MARRVITTESEAWGELPPRRTRPDRREGRHNLPFHELSDIEFEVFCFLLLRREHPGDDIRYYAGTGDGGRDLVHRMTTPDGVRVRLVQCKRYTSTVGVAVSLTSWRAMALDLDNLWGCQDRTRASEFLVRLLSRHPALFADDRGVYFLARVAALFPDDQRRCAYEVVRAWGARHGPQAFGELVGLRHLLHPDDGWAREQVEAALAGPAGAEWVAVGVAFAAANLWCEPECRARATEVLCRLVPHPTEAVGHAVMSVYLTRDDLPLDDATLVLFRMIADNPEILRQPSLDEAFFDHLLDALLVDADLVCRLAEAAVTRRGADLQSLAQGFYMAGSVLIDISLRLQRSRGDFRRRGMNLFEALLDLGVSEAVGVARSTDLRLVVGGGPVRMPRRRRSQSARPDDW